MEELARTALISASQQVIQQGICQANNFISPINHSCHRNLQDTKETEVTIPCFADRKKNRETRVPNGMYNKLQNNND
jgi:hypothetical protein